MQGKSESLLDRRHYNFRLNAPAHTKKKLIKLKDVNSLVYQMESLGSKTANCITPEELWFPFHRLKCLSLYSIYIYTINGFDRCFEKKPEPIKKYKIHISASGKPRSTIDHISFWLQGVYIKSIMQVLNTLSPHTSSNLHFCVVHRLLAWLAKAWRLPIHCSIVQSEWAL